MTKKYKLFGTPGNIEEFADKVKKRGIDKIEIRGAEECWVHNFYNPFGSSLPPKAHGNVLFVIPYTLNRIGYALASDPMNEVSYHERVYNSPISSSLPTELEKQMQMNQKILEKSKEWRRFLSDSGITATIMISQEDKSVPLTDEIEKKWKIAEPEMIKKIEELRKIERKSF